MADTQKAVENGACLLDRKIPGWATAIELNDLDMSDCSHCILGQLFQYDHEGWMDDEGYFYASAYELAVHELNITGVDSELGFDVIDGLSEYAKLNLAWHRAVEERLG